ncbi:uncharacterized protein LOC128730535 [Anopheles nili]|uniref:uncharacterized protein LOC128730535 n=1 Tax=Anopheles nili TaxID=185578 RepID=UPI00237ABFCD|nr:uncharacterized protein LOC128730535 [Anopheles nili]
MSRLYNQHNTDRYCELELKKKAITVFQNGRAFSCLVCPTSGACLEHRHPLQRLISYDELIAKYARKMNRDQHDGIKIYTCPYCALDRLTVDALFTHLRIAHHTSAVGESRLGEVYCPVCVCFRLENAAVHICSEGSLADHMLSRHCFASTHQYQEEYQLRKNFCCNDEFELIRFLATFLPPTIFCGESSLLDVPIDQDSNSKRILNQSLLICPICLETIDDEDCRELNLCSHQFHADCINRWLQEKKCCPVCRCDCS